MRLLGSEARRLLGDGMDELPYPDSVHGPPWATGELVQTEAARRKLAAWADATPPPWPPWRVGAAKDGLRPSFHGDLYIFGVLAKVLADLPPPVSAYAVDRVTWIATGLLQPAWISAIPATGDRPWLVVLSSTAADTDFNDERTSYLCAHEVSHAWLLPEPEPGDRPVTAVEHHHIQKTPEADVERLHAPALPEVRRRRADYADNETEADRLTAAWGYKLPAPQEEEETP